MHGPSAEEEDEHIAAINIIPLVDVVLVLLIIFMVTTVFSRDAVKDLELPEGSRAEQKTQPPVEITVTVDKKADIYLNGVRTDLEGLNVKINSLSQKDEKQKRQSLLVLRGDKEVAYGKIMPVLDEISRTKVKLTLALQAPASSRQ